MDANKIIGRSHIFFAYNSCANKSKKSIGGPQFSSQREIPSGEWIDGSAGATLTKKRS